MKSFNFGVALSALLVAPHSRAINATVSEETRANFRPQTASSHTLGGAKNPVVDRDIHRLLMGCRDDFICPKNSQRKRGRSCYDSFSDCECDPGYEKKRGACIAREGLCTTEYLEMAMIKQAEVEHWIDKVYESAGGEEKYMYMEKMNEAFSEAWDDYNMGKASCEMYVFDDNEGDRRRLRCCRAFRNFVKKVGNGIKRVATAVVKAVVTVVEIVVDVVEEIVECAVGISNGLRCGLIGCAFGLFGVAADVAFTIATGGANKLAGAVCSITDSAGGDGGKEKKDNVELEILKTVLEGVGGMVCEVNKKIESSELGMICDFKEDMEKADNGLLFFEKQLVTPAGRVVFRFLEAFQTAMCGNPGSAVLDLIEDLVSCKIGCARDDNLCVLFGEDGKGDEDPVPSPGPGPGVDTTSADQGGPIEYKKHSRTTCRVVSDIRGIEGFHYTTFSDRSADQCEGLCSDNVSCRAFQHNRKKNICKVWSTTPKGFKTHKNNDCSVKLP